MTCLQLAAAAAAARRQGACARLQHLHRLGCRRGAGITSRRLCHRSHPGIAHSNGCGFHEPCVVSRRDVCFVCFSPVSSRQFHVQTDIALPPPDCSSALILLEWQRDELTSPSSVASSRSASPAAAIFENTDRTRIWSNAEQNIVQRLSRTFLSTFPPVYLACNSPSDLSLCSI